jgi:hypothetical protein
MIIVGCDFHPAWQQVAWVDTETGEAAGRKIGPGHPCCASPRVG